MSNFHGAARSNYLQVKDTEAFKAWVASAPRLGMWEKNQLFAIYSTCPDNGTWPSTAEDDEGQIKDFDMVLELSPHLADGQVAVLIETGSDKLRYITGNAVAFDNTGKAVRIKLDDIYKQAAETFGVEVNEAEY